MDGKRGGGREWGGGELRLRMLLGTTSGSHSVKCTLRFIAGCYVFNSYRTFGNNVWNLRVFFLRVKQPPGHHLIIAFVYHWVCFQSSLKE